MSESCYTAEIYALYAIGSLDGPDLAEFDRHLRQGCNICQTELVQARDLWAMYAAAATPVAPSAEMRGRILAAIRHVVPIRQSVRPGHAWWRQAAAAAAILGVGLATGWNLRHLPQPVAELPHSAPPPPSALPTPAPTPATESLEQENRALRARIEALDTVLAAQQAKSQVPIKPQEGQVDGTLARLQAEAQQAQARVAQLEAQARQLEAQATAAEAKARDAEQRIQTAANDSRQALEREVRLRETVTGRIRELENENAKFRRVIDDQQRRIQQNLQLASFFASPNLRFYQYQGTRNGPLAKAHVVALEGSKVVFYAYHLPQLPAGRTYQLWLIRGQSPAIVSGGVFQTDQAGNAVVQFADPSLIKDIRQFAVTDEPPGGSSGPTGKQFLRASS